MKSSFIEAVELTEQMHAILPSKVESKVHSQSQSTKLYTKDECAPDAQNALDWLAEYLGVKAHILENRQFVRMCSQWNDTSEYYSLPSGLL